MSSSDVLRNLTDALISMQPEAIVRAAAGLESFSARPHNELREIASGLPRTAELALAAMKMLEEVCALTAISSSGYSANGTPAEWERQQSGAFRV